MPTTTLNVTEQFDATLNAMLTDLWPDPEPRPERGDVINDASYEARRAWDDAHGLRSADTLPADLTPGMLVAFWEQPRHDAYYYGHAQKARRDAWSRYGVWRLAVVRRTTPKSAYVKTLGTVNEYQTDPFALDVNQGYEARWAPANSRVIVPIGFYADVMDTIRQHPAYQTLVDLAAVATAEREAEQAKWEAEQEAERQARKPFKAMAKRVNDALGFSYLTVGYGDPSVAWTYGSRFENKVSPDDALLHYALVGRVTEGVITQDEADYAERVLAAFVTTHAHGHNVSREIKQVIA